MKRMKRTRDHPEKCKDKRTKMNPSSPRAVPSVEELVAQSQNHVAVKKITLVPPSEKALPSSLSSKSDPKSEPLSVTYENELIFMTTLMIQCGRYEDALATVQGFLHAKLFSPSNYCPSEEELFLLSEAFHKVIEKLVFAWKELSRQLTKETNKHYHQMIIKRLSKTKEDILEIGEKMNVVAARLERVSDVGVVSRTLSFKLQADCLGYQFKVNDSPPSQINLQKLERLYQKAFNLAQEKLSPSHNLSLQISLDFSKFYFKLMKNSSNALDIAKKVFDAAIKDIIMLDSVADPTKKESLVILQKLRDLVEKCT